MGEMSETTPPFWETTPLDRMTRAEWESLCDGCGKCCIHKLEDDETGELYPTNIACKLLDRRTGQCSDYRRRHAYVPECVRLTPAKLRQLDWLPTTCAYRLLDEGKPLPDWHYLVSGDRETVHTAGISVRGWTVSENDVGDFENHIVDRIL
nr:YcgN family cysteine cluster protein [Sphingomonas solaris]